MNARFDRGFRMGVAMALCLAAPGCTDRDLGPVEPVVQSGYIRTISQPASDAIDLLVMVDNSNSMSQEQDSLARNFPLLVERLTNPPDEDGDGQRDYPVVTDLHIGVIDTDMGTGGYAVNTCRDPIDGDDGILQHSPSANVADCADAYPSFLSWAEDDDSAAFSHAFSCIATLGTGGCGFEQQLEAVEKALTTHRDGANAGFLRDDSLLAILLVTDEEDCSIRDDIPDATDIFDTSLALGPLNLRCYSHRDRYVKPVDEYVRALLALRPANPERLVVAGIVGIPPDSGCNLGHMNDADFDCLLQHPRMEEVVDHSAEGGGERLTPSCDVPGLGEAFPPRRIVELIKAINHEGNNGIVQSICQSDFGPAMDAITSLIQTKIRGACLSRPLYPNDENQIRCIVQETMATSDDCPAGRIDLGVASGKRRCQICQKGDGDEGRLRDEIGQDLTSCSRFNASGDYWEYIPANDDCPVTGQVLFRGEAVPGPGSVARLECISRVGDE